MMRRFAIFAMFVAFSPWVAAQRGGAHVSSHGGAGSNSTHGNRLHGPSFVSGNIGRSTFDRHGYGYGSPYLSLPFPFFDDAYDSGDMYSTGYPVAAPLPPYLPPVSAGEYGQGSFGPGIRSQAYVPGQPLMIELQNGRYVQVSSAAIDGEATPLTASANNSSVETFSQNSSGNIANPAETLAPVILIFKDGHQAQVHDYTIANGTLYARGDFYTDGYWDKQIDLASLNLPQTVRANDQHGVKFLLPSAPNEVVTRP
jgi:hypothetical protein